MASLSNLQNKQATPQLVGQMAAGWSAQLIPEGGPLYRGGLLCCVEPGMKGSALARSTLVFSCGLNGGAVAC